MQKHISSLMDMHAEIWTAYFQATEEKLKRRSAIKVDSPMMPDMKSQVPINSQVVLVVQQLIGNGCEKQKVK